MNQNEVQKLNLSLKAKPTHNESNLSWKTKIRQTETNLPLKTKRKHIKLKCQKENKPDLL